MASLAGSLTVSVVSSAMHSVADSPGRQPTMMPHQRPAQTVQQRGRIENRQVGVDQVAEAGRAWNPPALRADARGRSPGTPGWRSTSGSQADHQRRRSSARASSLPPGCLALRVLQHQDRDGQRTALAASQNGRLPHEPDRQRSAAAPSQARQMPMTSASRPGCRRQLRRSRQLLAADAGARSARCAGRAARPEPPNRIMAMPSRPGTRPGAA